MIPALIVGAAFVAASIAIWIVAVYPDPSCDPLAAAAGLLFCFGAYFLAVGYLWDKTLLPSWLVILALVIGVLCGLGIQKVRRYFSWRYL